MRITRKSGESNEATKIQQVRQNTKKLVEAEYKTLFLMNKEQEIRAESENPAEKEGKREGRLPEIVQDRRYRYMIEVLTIKVRKVAIEGVVRLSLDMDPA